MMACKVAPSAQHRREDVSSPELHCYTPDNAALQGWEWCSPYLCFSPCSSADKSSVTSVHTSNKSQATVTPSSYPFFVAQRKVSVHSPSDCDASSHGPASGPPRALASSHGSQGLLTELPHRVQHCYQCRCSQCWCLWCLLDCHELAWVWKHMGTVCVHWTNSNISMEATPLLLETSISVCHLLTHLYTLNHTSLKTSSLCPQPPHGLQTYNSFAKRQKRKSKKIKSTGFVARDKSLIHHS